MDFLPAYLHTNISFFALIAILIVSGLISFYVYRNTTPPLKPGWKIFLGTLRTLSVGVILLLLFSPELSIIWYQDMPKKIAIAIDRSGSMGTMESEQTRSGRAQNIAKNIFSQLANQSEVSLYQFNADTLPDSLALNDTTFGGTDYTRAIQSIVRDQEILDDLILFTDGNLSMGTDPLYSLQGDVPRIHAIGFGDTIKIPDIFILNVRANKIVYEGKPTELQVEFVNQGPFGHNTQLIVKEGGEIVHAENITINSSDNIIARTIKITPKRAGINTYQVELTAIPDERNTKNNRYTKTLSVRKGKIKVGLIAGKIDFDTKFLISIFESNENVDFSAAVIKKKGVPFFSNIAKVIAASDVLIIYSLPDDMRAFQELNAALSTKKPVLMIINHELDANKVELLKRYFPVAAYNSNTQPFETQVLRTNRGRMFAQLNVFETESQNSLFWENCPPIKTGSPWLEFASAINILLESKTLHPQRNLKIPVLLSHENRGLKSLLLLGSGFWRWHFAQARDNTMSTGWKRILNNMVRWLASTGSDKNVIISDTKDSYEIGEGVAVTTQVYDGALNPISDAIVRTEISGPGGKFELLSQNNSPGSYLGRFSPYAEGTYNIKSTAFKNDIALGSDSTRVVVIPVNREFMYTNQDTRFLRELTEKYGGVYYDEENALKLPEHIDVSKKRARRESTVELWHKMIILILILTLLTLEWFLRKRLGLA